MSTVYSTPGCNRSRLRQQAYFITICRYGTRDWSHTIHLSIEMKKNYWVPFSQSSAPSLRNALSHPQFVDTGIPKLSCFLAIVAIGRNRFCILSSRIRWNLFNFISLGFPFAVEWKIDLSFLFRFVIGSFTVSHVPFAELKSLFIDSNILFCACKATLFRLTFFRWGKHAHWDSVSLF